MKSFKIFVFTVLSLIILQSCKPKVVFTEPQPAGLANLTSFPKKIQGDYFSERDREKVSISDKMIVLFEYDEELLGYSDLDSAVQLIGDSLIDCSNGKSISYERIGDSLMEQSVWADTLFAIDPSHVVKKSGSSYYLSSPYRRSTWKVDRIKVSRGGLTHSHISSDTAVEILRKLGVTLQTIEEAYLCSISGRNFKKFIKQGGFTDRKDYRRTGYKSFLTIEGNSF